MTQVGLFFKIVYVCNIPNDVGLSRTLLSLQSTYDYIDCDKVDNSLSTEVYTMIDSVHEDDIDSN